VSILSCFDGYITLGVLNNSPRSGLTVEKLPGITSNQIAKLQKFDSLNLTDWYTELYERSVNGLEQDVMEKLSDQFLLDKVVDSQVTGQFPDGALTDNTTAEALAGVEIDTSDSKYTLTYLNSVKFNTDSIPSPNEIDILVHDQVDGRLLDTITLTGVQVGDNELFFEPDNRFNFNKLYIAYSTTTYTLKETERNELEWFNKKSGFPREINNGGLIIDYETKCDVQQFICTRLNTFRQALWYRIGIEIMMERLTSEKVNMFTIDRETATALIEEVYQPKYDQALKNTKIKVLDDPNCFICRSPVRSVPLIP